MVRYGINENICFPATISSP